MKCGIVHDLIFEKHETGLGHPEQKKRASCIFEKIGKANLSKQTENISIRDCSFRELSLVHKPHYLQSSKKEIENGMDATSSNILYL